MRYSWLIGLFLMASCKPKADLPVVLELDDLWEFRQVGDSLWRSASVPGNNFTDLLTHKLIDDPFIGANEEEVQWVSDMDWEYRTTFGLSEALLAKRFASLSFEGLDTYATVYLNDSLVLNANNAFRIWSLDTEQLKPLLKSQNELRLVFKASKQVEEAIQAERDVQLPGGNRVFTRKAQFQYGWDWGPILNAAGIWRPVKLKFSDDISIEHLRIKQLEIKDKKARFNCILEVNNALSDDYNFELFVNDSIAVRSKGVPSNGQYVIPFEIRNPKLWWPHNIGEPHLYEITAVIKKGNTLLGSRTTKFGVRDVELIREKDTLGASFYFKVNGVPVFAKGANYIPQNSFQNNVSEAHYERLLNDAVLANMNMLRVWGGGIYENDKFYELCDEKGIMVWQDFMFACAMYPGDESFLKNVEQEAIDNVIRLQHHPSLVLWCGNNENSEGWHRWGWQQDLSAKEKAEIWKDYLKIFDSILPVVVDTYSTVDYWESSPKFGRGNPQYQYEGDAHDWWVWHDGYPFEHFEEHIPRFMSEFGFQSFPSAEVIGFMNELDTTFLNTKAVKNHQKHHRGFELITDYMARDFPVPEDPNNYIYMSQLVQAYGITMGIEAHRRAKPYNMGSLYWQLNDCWPAISWSSIDFFGNWKALHYKAKRSFENLLVSAVVENDQIAIWIVNDHLKAFQENLEIEIVDFRGKVLWKELLTLDIEANSSEQKHLIDLKHLNIDPTEVVLKTTLHNKTRLFYLENPKTLKLEQKAIKSVVTKLQDGFQIELLSPVLQKDVFLSTRKAGFFNNNYFDLLPNEAKIIRFTSEAGDIDDLKIISFNNFIR
jgi:beta-mannosidase